MKPGRLNQLFVVPLAICLAGSGIAAAQNQEDAAGGQAEDAAQAGEPEVGSETEEARRQTPTPQVQLKVKVRTLRGLRDALIKARYDDQARAQRKLDRARPKTLTSRPAEQRLGDATLVTLANRKLSGQLVLVGRPKGTVRFASLCAAD